MRILIIAAFLFTEGFIAACCFADDRLFVEQIAPLIARRCLGCHNESKREGDVSLIEPTKWADGDHVVPFRSAESHLLDLIRPVDGVAQMPKDAAPLSEEEILVIKRWIDSGAPVPSSFRIKPQPIANLDWWSLKALGSADEELSAADVDRMVDSKLRASGLQPLPEADPRVLIRRLKYDLHGLPPTPDEVVEFVRQYKTQPAQTWSAWIDRFLDASEFGEKWAQHWLDLARYAETHGYDKDQPRNNAWPYRDYVIRSLNEDKPFGQFASEQIAGDLFSDDSGEGIIATGFSAAGPWDLIAHKEVGEAKLDGRIAKHLDRDEMVSAVFNVFLSTTAQCARCHDHKFDPIRSEDYYRLHAVFADVDRADRVFAGLSQDQQREKRELESERDNLVRERDTLRSQRESTIKQETNEVTKQIDRLLKKAVSVPPPTQHGFHSTIVTRADETKWIQVELDESVPLKQIELYACHDNFNGIGAGFGFPVRFKVEVASTTIGASDTRELLNATDHDFANPEGTAVVVPCDEQPVRVIRLTATHLAERKADFILALGELRAIEADGKSNVARTGTVTASDMIPANSRWAPEFLIDDRYHEQRLEERDRQSLVGLRARKQAIIERITKPDDVKHQERLETQISDLNSQIERFPPGQFVYALASTFKPSGKFVPTNGTPREIHVLERGDLRLQGTRAFPGAPALWSEARPDFAHNQTDDGSNARADLADYVTDRDNPLTWRSIANRVWQWTMGKPIVATPNDFGRMGMQPTHPDLLDRLAIQLRDDPQQSIKSMVRLLVSTQAYRRASYLPGNDERIAQNEKLDRENDLRWRGVRRRLTAEEFRDTILAISGSLRTDARGGPGFKDFVIEQPQHSPHYEYRLHDPADVTSHRRTVYRFVVRSQPQPMLTTLDCADPSISVAQRDESTTALQALAQWNNRLIELMSRTFADRLRQETDSGVEAIARACQLAWGRPPTQTELAALSSLAKTQDYESLCRVVMNASALMYLD